MSTKIENRKRRKLRIRAKISGTHACPRLVVFRSNKALYVQCVDDEKNATLLSVSVQGKTTAKAKELGQLILTVAKKKGITRVVFDRGGYRYHGVIKMIADTVREGGVKI